jgi:hypothetical protein
MPLVRHLHVRSTKWVGNRLPCPLFHLCPKSETGCNEHFRKIDRPVSDSCYALRLRLLLCRVPDSDFLASGRMGRLIVRLVGGTYSACSPVDRRTRLFNGGRQMASNWLFRNSYQQGPILIAYGFRNSSGSLAIFAAIRRA